MHVVVLKHSWKSLHIICRICWMSGSVNKEMYIEILSLLRDAVRKKRPEKWRTKICLLLHDNAPVHRSVVVMNFLRKNDVTTLEKPPYTSGLATAYFCLFTWLITASKRWRFCDANNIIKNATKELKRFLQNGFQECFQQLYNRWQNFVVTQGCHFDVNVA
jgi:transposase